MLEVQPTEEAALPRSGVYRRIVCARVDGRTPSDTTGDCMSSSLADQAETQ